MQRRFGTLIWPPYEGYFTLPPFSDPSLNAISADGAGSSMQNPRNEVYHGPENGIPSVRCNPASESIHDVLKGLGTLPEPSAISQSSYLQIGLERNFLNCGYSRQTEINQNLYPHLHSNHAPLQLGSTFNYQQQQKCILQQPSSLYGAGDTQTMINQRIGLQPNQLNSIYAFQESLQKTSDVQLFKNGQAFTTVPMQLQFNKPNAIQDSQGTKDNPIRVPEVSRTDLLDSIYQKIQKCKEECLHDVLKIHKHFVSKMPQYVSRNMAESAAKKVHKIESMIKLLNLKRSSMEYIVDHRVQKNIAGIYFFTSLIRNKHLLFAGPGEESNSNHGEQQTVPLPSATKDENHAHQKQDTLQQEAVAVSEVEKNVVSPLQPTQKSTDSQPSDGSVSVTQSKNIDQEPVSQISPIERLIKAVKEASPESLMAAVCDMRAAIRAANRLPAQAYEDYSQMRRLTAFNAEQNFHDIDSRICSGSHMLDSPQSSANCHKDNKKLMVEIDLLKKTVFDTQVMIVEPDAGSQVLESTNITVSCSFTAVAFKNSEIFSHLIPASMQVSVPRDYPQSMPIIELCRHQNCGQMCALLQTKFESWSGNCDMTSVLEIVKAWNACAREVYLDIFLGPGKGRERLGQMCALF